MVYEAGIQFKGVVNSVSQSRETTDIQIFLKKIVYCSHNYKTRIPMKSSLLWQKYGALQIGVAL